MWQFFQQLQNKVLLHICVNGQLVNHGGAVLIGGFNDEEIAALAELTKQYPLDVRFIEMMPMYNSGDFDETAFLPCEKVLEVLPELVAVEPDGCVAQL